MLNHTAIPPESEGNRIAYHPAVISRARKTFSWYFNPADWRLARRFASLPYTGSIALPPVGQTPRMVEALARNAPVVPTYRDAVRTRRDPAARNWRWNMYTVKVASFIGAQWWPMAAQRDLRYATTLILSQFRRAMTGINCPSLGSDLRRAYLRSQAASVLSKR